jgi:hypothetical protein
MNTARFCQFRDVWGNKWSFCSEEKKIGTTISSRNKKLSFNTCIFTYKCILCFNLLSIEMKISWSGPPSPSHGIIILLLPYEIDPGTLCLLQILQTRLVHSARWSDEHTYTTKQFKSTYNEASKWSQWYLNGERFRAGNNRKFVTSRLLTVTP